MSFPLIHHSACPVCRGKSIKQLMTCKDYIVSQESFSLWQCTDCTFIFTQDVPSAETIGPYYDSTNYISHHTEESKDLFFKAYRAVRDFMLGRKERLIRKYNKGNKILDIGAGQGFFLKYMQDKGYKVAGIEVSEGARNYVINTHQLDVHDMPALFDNTSITAPIDTVTMWHVLEHVHDLDGYFKRIHELLSPQGILIIAVPNSTSYDAKVFGNEWEAYDVPRHLWHFNRLSMAKLAITHGFKVIHEQSMPFDPYYIAMRSGRNKGQSLPMLRGLWYGTVANFKALINLDQASSIIYVLSKI